jgi:hypothetical protein
VTEGLWSFVRVAAETSGKMMNRFMPTNGATIVLTSPSIDFKTDVLSLA